MIIHRNNQSVQVADDAGVPVQFVRLGRERSLRVVRVAIEFVHALISFAEYSHRGPIAVEDAAPTFFCFLLLCLRSEFTILGLFHEVLFEFPHSFTRSKNGIPVDLLPIKQSTYCHFSLQLLLKQFHTL